MALSTDGGWSAGAVRVACLGDSITEGTVLKDRQQTAYPVVLGALLGPEYEVRNFGRSGATVTALGEGALPYRKLPLYPKALEWQPQIVIILLGTNDTKRAVFEAGSDTYATEYQAILDECKALASRPRIVLGLPVPVIGEGQFTINEPNRRQLRVKIAELVRVNQLECVDFDPYLAGKAEWYPDRVHPNAEATAVIARVVAEQIRKAL